MAKRPINLFTLVLLPAFLCLLVIPSAKAADPIYNGKALSDWLVLDLTGDASAKEAIRQIGANGIPILLDILGVKKSNKSSVLARLDSIELKQEFRSKDADLEDLRKLAVNGFAILGTNAEPALPQLAKQFNRQDETFFQTILALMAVGQKGFAVLTNAMNDPDEAVRNNLIWVLGEGGGNDPAVTQLLVNALKDPYFGNRGNAASFLGGKNADLVVPALIPLLDAYTNDYYAFEQVVGTLGGYGAAAKSATSKLYSIHTNVVMWQDRKLSHDMDSSIVEALRKIDRDAAAEAEAFLVNGGTLGASHSFTITLLPNGKTLLAGGFLQTKIPAVNNHVFADAKLFNPATGKWEDTGPMNEPREYHSATLLRNGKVLVAGGENLRSDGSVNRLSSAEIYDPTTGKWVKTDSMNAVHAGQAALQPDGKVLVYTGGFNDTTGASWDGVSKGWSRWISNQELYDPITGKWSVITNK